jgi:hypothetical protein
VETNRTITPKVLPFLALAALAGGVSVFVVAVLLPVNVAEPQSVAVPEIRPGILAGYLSFKALP